MKSIDSPVMKTPSAFQTFVGFIAIGIALAIYHAYDEITNYSQPISNACHVTGTLSCSPVFPYSHPFGIPLYIFGIVWFPLLLVVLLFMRPHLEKKIMIPLLMVGNAFTVYLWYLDLAIVLPSVHAICPVCLSMYATNYVLTIVAYLST
jgi:uncharacterized membrane protein